MEILTNHNSGAGIALGAYRIVTGGELHYYIIVGYIIVIILTYIAPKHIIPIAYDSGGVTTSTVTVPLVAALGIGLATNIDGRSPLIDGFGLIAFASLFPMIKVMLYGILVERFHVKGDTELEKEEERISEIKEDIEEKDEDISINLGSIKNKFKSIFKKGEDIVESEKEEIAEKPSKEDISFESTVKYTYGDISIPNAVRLAGNKGSAQAKEFLNYNSLNNYTVFGYILSILAISSLLFINRVKNGNYQWKEEWKKYFKYDKLNPEQYYVFLGSIRGQFKKLMDIFKKSLGIV